jgi:histidinol phosphatase-like PHP family hydrolase
MPDKDAGMTPKSVKIPTNHAEALFQLAQHRSTREDRTTQSELIRKYIAKGLRADIGSDSEIPGEIRDLLDDDLVANAGGSESEVEA